ncbi:hypothetical protein [Pontibacillus marinus]|uniref:hypothetical protein n=1 Tax=Pontibacillus marinus TaxID=273164 RepID=UPI0012B5CB80|nr:hypothetical protein [Pontibacillus marinus]
MKINKRLFASVVSAFLLFTLCFYLISDKSFSQGVKQNHDLRRVMEAENLLRVSVAFHSFEEVVEKADVIAEVEIGEVKKEVSTPMPKTFFHAKIVNAFKGGSALKKNSITVVQAGNSKNAISGALLFKKGSKKILFMKEHSEPNTYWLLGEQGHYYHVSNENDEVVKEVSTSEDLTEIEKKTQDVLLKYKINGETSTVNMPRQYFNKDDFISALKKQIEAK